MWTQTESETQSPQMDQFSTTPGSNIFTIDLNLPTNTVQNEFENGFPTTTTLPTNNELKQNLTPQSDIQQFPSAVKEITTLSSDIITNSESSTTTSLPPLSTMTGELSTEFKTTTLATKPAQVISNQSPNMTMEDGWILTVTTSSKPNFAESANKISPDLTSTTINALKTDFVTNPIFGLTTLPNISSATTLKIPFSSITTPTTSNLVSSTTSASSTIASNLANITKTTLTTPASIITTPMLVTLPTSRIPILTTVNVSMKNKTNISTSGTTNRPDNIMTIVNQPIPSSFITMSTFNFTTPPDSPNIITKLTTKWTSTTTTAKPLWNNTTISSTTKRPMSASEMLPFSKKIKCF